MGNLTADLNWPRRVLCITCLIPCNFLWLLARCRWSDFLRATTVAYYRYWHPPWWSKVTGPLTSWFNMPIYRCGLKPDEFRRASVNRTSDPSPTRINSGHRSEALVWTWPKGVITSGPFDVRTWGRSYVETTSRVVWTQHKWIWPYNDNVDPMWIETTWLM